MRRLLFAAALFAIACSDDPVSPDGSITHPDARADGGVTADSGVPGDGGVFSDAGTSTGGLALSQFCGAVQGAICDGFESCNCTLEGRHFDRSSCDRVRTTDCNESLEQFAAAVAAGVIEYDPSAAARCRDAVVALAASCTLIGERTLPLDCAWIFRDPVAIGGACTAPQGRLCAGGAGVCATDSMCVARPARGAECAAGACADGLFCDPLTNTCGDRPAPRPPLGDGEGPCRASFDCAAGLACDPMSSTCTPGGALDAACGDPSQCNSSLSCVRRFANRTCAARVPLNGACLRDRDCAADLVCVAGMCAAAPGLNQPCAEAASGFACAAGLACDSDNTRTCVTAPGRGEMCLIGAAICAEGLGCQEGTNVCIDPPGDGQPCTFPNNLCAAGFGCDFTQNGSICSPRRGQGEQCQSQQICNDGLFCDFSTTTCQPLLAEDALCPQGERCANGLECNDLAGADSCQPIPSTMGAPCLDSCGGNLACLGAGGACAPEICASN